MNKDFHLYATFMAAALAGYHDEDAKKIAFAAQMVDDFNETHSRLCHTVTGMGGTVVKSFWNTYFRNNNSSIFDISDTWMPFHFIPGKAILPNQHEDTSAAFACGFGNPIALVCGEIIPENKTGQEPLLPLERIGITMHVLADSYAHSSFTGLTCYYPRISENISVMFIDQEEGLDDYDHVPVVFSFLLTGIAYYGHGAAGHVPDLSWAKFSYTWKGFKPSSPIFRSNPDEFAKAFAKMVEILRLSRGNRPVENTASFTLKTVSDHLNETSFIKQTQGANLLFRNEAIREAKKLIPVDIDMKLRCSIPLTYLEAERLERIREQTIKVKSIVGREHIETDVKVSILLDEALKKISFDVESDTVFQDFYGQYKNDAWLSADKLNQEYEIYRDNTEKDAVFETQAQLHKDAVYRAIGINHNELVDLLKDEFAKAVRPGSWF